MGTMDKQIAFLASRDPAEEYEVTVVSYSPPTDDTRDEPGDGGEVDFAHTVIRTMCGRKVEEVSFDEFLERYAAHRGIRMDRLGDVRQVVCEVAMIEMADRLASAWEESMEDRDV